MHKRKYLLKNMNYISKKQHFKPQTIFYIRTKFGELWRTNH